MLKRIRRRVAQVALVGATGALAAVGIGTGLLGWCDSVQLAMTVMITQAKSDPSELGRDGLLALAIILGEAHDLGHAIRAEEGDAGDPLEDATACEGVDGAMRDMLDAMKPADA